MEDAKKKIQALVVRYGGTHENFARKLGISKETVRSWLQRDAIPDKSIHLLLENLPNLNPAWLFEDEEPMVFEGPKLYTNIYATAGREEQYLGDEIPEFKQFSVPGVNADAFLMVSGCSMKPTINEGDIIGIKEVGALDIIESERIIYMIVTNDDERMIKHISKIGRETMTLTSDNPDYKPFKVELSNITKIWEVIWHGSKL